MSAEQLPKEKLHPESCLRHGMWVVGLGCPYCIRDERDMFKGQAEINAQTVKDQAEEIRELSNTVDGFLGPKFAAEMAYYTGKSQS